MEFDKSSNSMNYFDKIIKKEKSITLVFLCERSYPRLDDVFV